MIVIASGFAVWACHFLKGGYWHIIKQFHHFGTIGVVAGRVIVSGHSETINRKRRVRSSFPWNISQRNYLILPSGFPQKYIEGITGIHTVPGIGIPPHAPDYVRSQNIRGFNLIPQTCVYRTVDLQSDSYPGTFNRIGFDRHSSYDRIRYKQGIGF